MSKIGCIIPISNPGLYKDLINSIYGNSRRPDFICAWNNSEHPAATSFKFETIFNSRGIYTPYEVWDFGRALLKDHCDYISFLNDDLVLRSNFFEEIVNSFEKEPLAGVLCPQTVPTEKELSCYIPIDSCKPMRRREGWAFTARKKILDEMPLFPEDLKLFYGDNFLWHWTYHLGYRWFKTERTAVYHVGGASTSKIGKVERKLIMEHDREVCKRALVKDKIGKKRRGA